MRKPCAKEPHRSESQKMDAQPEGVKSGGVAMREGYSKPPVDPHAQRTPKKPTSAEKRVADSRPPNSLSRLSKPYIIFLPQRRTQSRVPQCDSHGRTEGRSHQIWRNSGNNLFQLIEIPVALESDWHS